MKKEGILVLFGFMLLVACAEQKAPLQGEPDQPVVPTDVGVTRVMPETAIAGEAFTMKLYINIGPGDTYYLIEEVVPTEFEVIDQEVDKNNHLKLFKLQDASNRVVEYNIMTQTPGTYTFSGEYAMDNLEKPVQIMGATTVIVE